MPTFDDLPPPSPDALARQRQLLQHCRGVIEAEGGSISFDRFMADALYHPSLGYYTSPNFCLGRSGDFTTAAEISPLYAQCFATATQPLLQRLSSPSVIEIGAGSGQFAVDFLLALEKAHALPAHYYIHEISPALRVKQRDKIKALAPAFLPRITWCDTLPNDVEGVIIANEVLDALPFHCFESHDQTLYERRIAFENGALAWHLSPPQGDLAAALHALTDVIPFEGHTQGEICLRTPAFVQTLAAALKKGMLLFADYGYGRPTRYHPARHRGTLTCFYQHHRHDNPLILTGLQDMTAHVDFTQVAEAGVLAGCTLAGYTTQAAFLLASGLTDHITAAEKNSDDIAKFHCHQAVKTLTLPTEMGEIIKIMGLAKGVEYLLPGMAITDRRGEL